MSVKIYPPTLENFERAFSDSCGGCRRECECGRVLYNPEGGWDWEEGELEELEKSKATSVEWTVQTLSMEGCEYCLDCDCWHDRAAKFISLIERYGPQIAKFLTLERKRKLVEAEASPVVT